MGEKYDALVARSQGDGDDAALARLQMAAIDRQAAIFAIDATSGPGMKDSKVDFLALNQEHIAGTSGWVEQVTNTYVRAHPSDENQRLLRLLQQPYTANSNGHAPNGDGRLVNVMGSNGLVTRSAREWIESVVGPILGQAREAVYTASAIAFKPEEASQYSEEQRQAKLAHARAELNAKLSKVQTAFNAAVRKEREKVKPDGTPDGMFDGTGELTLKIVPTSKEGLGEVSVRVEPDVEGTLRIDHRKAYDAAFENNQRHSKSKRPSASIR